MSSSAPDAVRARTSPMRSRARRIAFCTDVRARSDAPANDRPPPPSRVVRVSSSTSASSSAAGATPARCRRRRRPRRCPTGGRAAGAAPAGRSCAAVPGERVGLADIGPEPEQVVEPPELVDRGADVRPGSRPPVAGELDRPAHPQPGGQHGIGRAPHRSTAVWKAANSSGPRPLEHQVVVKICVPASPRCHPCATRWHSRSVRCHALPDRQPAEGGAPPW